ncbi:hypothetical protein U1872_10380 [Sphingomonas sp. RB3P16]|uniref:hypothetical protein n=1 Tax=Parasphingomonas frigoris TaxID=3096163 RepID=UPI002FC6EA09
MTETDTHGLQVGAALNRRVQLRRENPRGWTAAKRNAFLDHLAVTSNVTHAAQSVGMSTVAAHTLRRRDAGFAEAWQKALDDGYAHLEAAVLAQAIGQQADPERSGDPEARPVDIELALRMLAARKGGAGSGQPRGPASVKRVPIEQVTAALKRKLDALAKRLGRG